MTISSYSIHAPIKGASAGTTLLAPLKLRAGDAEVIFFVEDHDLAGDLAHAINNVIAKHEAKADLARRVPTVASATGMRATLEPVEAA